MGEQSAGKKGGRSGHEGGRERERKEEKRSVNGVLGTASSSHNCLL